MQTKILFVSAALLATQVCAVPRPQDNSQDNNDIFNQVANGIDQFVGSPSNDLNTDNAAQFVATNSAVAAVLTAFRPEATLPPTIAAANTATRTAGENAAATNDSTDTNDVSTETDTDTDRDADTDTDTVATATDTNTDDVTESETGTDSDDVDTETDSSSLSDSKTTSTTNTVSSRTTSQRTTTRPTVTNVDLPTEGESSAHFMTVSWLSVAVAAASSLIGMRSTVF
ncbi:hypothetical protein IWQ61_002596 [Dispira simplex]|nr:hypothetical protein IWQ61_002596 [Dispira simplex]